MNVQQARKCLVTLNRLWREIPVSHHDIGTAMMELILALQNQEALDLEYVILPDGKIYGFTEAAIRTAEAAAHMDGPLTQVLRTRLPEFIRSDSVRDVWCGLADILSFDLMSVKAYTDMRQISQDEWEEIVARCTNLIGDWI